VTQVISLRAGGASARLLPRAGGRVSRLSLMSLQGGAVDVVYPYPEDIFDPIHWAKGGIYPLLPYSNRIESSQLRLDDGLVTLQPHPDAHPHTLHGDAHTQAWDVVHTASNVAMLTLVSPASPAWPWQYNASQTFKLTPSRVSITLTLTNASNRRMPAGIGLHPYFRHAADEVLAHKAKRSWPMNSAFFPASPRVLRAEERYDVPRQLPEGTLTDYFDDWDGQVTVSLPGGAVVTMSCMPIFAHLVVHRPPEPIYLCLEPVSHVTNAFNLVETGVLGTGSHLLEPGASLSGEIHISLE
jgi:aldose 1-epimerase